MQFTTLPGTGISVSRLCLGTMTFGSPVAEPDAIRLVHDAAELGVNFIDTANMYEATTASQALQAAWPRKLSARPSPHGGRTSSSRRSSA